MSGLPPHYQYTNLYMQARAVEQGEIPQEKDHPCKGLDGTRAKLLWKLLRGCWNMVPESRPDISAVINEVRKISAHLGCTQRSHSVLQLRRLRGPSQESVTVDPSTELAKSENAGCFPPHCPTSSPSPLSQAHPLAQPQAEVDLTTVDVTLDVFPVREDAHYSPNREVCAPLPSFREPCQRDEVIYTRPCSYR